MHHEIIQGDCLEVMKQFPDNHFSGIVTDPPYGLSFMGKAWDREVPGIEYWRECLRITKPGGYLMSMGGSRTFHRLACSTEDAGWEIRDCVMWIYGSGFPKSHNYFGIEGFGTALKPAYEPITVAMKPCDGTFKQNAEKWGQGVINIDGCRIATDDSWEPSIHAASDSIGTFKTKERTVEQHPKGRWPANVILDEEAGAMLDEQSGFSKSPTGKCNAKKNNSLLKESKGLHTPGRERQWEGLGDSGGASRFFYCAKASSRERNEGIEGLPDIIGKRTQNGGDDTRGRPTPVNKNHHPTVKPLALMRYLITLIAPPTNALILDPFAGSGTTILAAKQLGISAVGIEKSTDYSEIAKSRIASYVKELTLF